MFSMPPQAGHPRYIPPPQRDAISRYSLLICHRAHPPVIDLTLNDDEDVSYVQPRAPSSSGRTTSLLVEVPEMQHGLPVFTTSADRRSEKRDGASGNNYMEQRAPRRSMPLAAAASSPKPQSNARLARPSQSQRSAMRLPTSRDTAAQNFSNNANVVKRRKTTHEGPVLGGPVSDATSRSHKAQAQASSSSRSTTPYVDLTLPPAAEQSKTVITGASRLQSSFGPYPSPEDGLVQDSIESDDSHSMAILQKVFELIKLALQPYLEELAVSDQKEITAKVEEKIGLQRSYSLTPGQTAAWLIRPDLRANYENNNGKFDRRYEREMAQEAKAYVDSYVQTLRELNIRPVRLGVSEESEGGSSSSVAEDILDDEQLEPKSRFARLRSSELNTRPMRLGASEESEGGSSSSAVEGIFDDGQLEQNSRFARPRSSESPITELSNDQLDGAGDSEPAEKTVRQSQRAKRTQPPNYVFRNKRRRRDGQLESIQRSAADNSMDHRPQSPVQQFDSSDELAGIRAIARTMQVPPKKLKTTSSEKDLLSLLREREIHGTTPFRVGQGRPSLKSSIYARLEDSFIRQSEWTDASGDIQSISWITDDAFLCGSTAHLDSHNMEYNKPGNLLLGSTANDTLRSFPDHRVPRPKSDKPNAAAMQQTQDPWLYSSVVSTAHCERNGYSFTASFDETVKIWSILPDGSSMKVAGTWTHGGKVNFVVTSDHHVRVATAADVASNAVRVYDFDEYSISDSTYDLYAGEKALSQMEDDQETKKWSYLPATIQWGKAPQVANLLLVGYSPRSETGDDADIPDHKKDTGELCVWNTANGEPIIISSSHTQNVFEVQWHPTQPIFVAATSPSGIFDTDKTKTQIRLFALNNQEVFMNIQALDCAAIDINELTIV